MGLKRMWRKLRGRSRASSNGSDRPLPRQAMRDADAIVTTNEVCERHGTGVILRRIFGGAVGFGRDRSAQPATGSANATAADGQVLLREIPNVGGSR